MATSTDLQEESETPRYAGDPSPEIAAELPTLDLALPTPSESYEGRCKQALQVAEEAFAKTGSWVIFYRTILGVNGIVKQLFSEESEFNKFIAGPEFETLHEMLAAIRSQDQSKSDAVEPERMITIRIPRSLHEALQEESKDCGLSINKLSISKLLLPANPRFIPEQQGRRRGRRPGPQGKRNQNKTTGQQPNDGNRVFIDKSHSQPAAVDSQPGVGERTSTYRWSDFPNGPSGNGPSGNGTH